MKQLSSQSNTFRWSKRSYFHHIAETDNFYIILTHLLTKTSKIKRSIFQAQIGNKGELGVMWTQL